jgi:hypothetical protein
MWHEWQSRCGRATARADPRNSSNRRDWRSGSASRRPLRASVLRAMSASRAVEGVLTYGDPPFLGQVRTACEKFRDVEETGRRRGFGAMLSIVSPNPLAANHARLSRAYAGARVGASRRSGWPLPR